MKRSVLVGLVTALSCPAARAQSSGSTATGLKGTDSSIQARFDELPYGRRYTPTANLWEVGLFGGVLAPAFDHNLAQPGSSYEPYRAAGVSAGARLAYFPFSFVGAEVEGMVAPTRTRTTDSEALLYSLRAHGLLQLPLGSVVPFALLGGGILGAASGPMGNDSDPLLHFGVGVKLPFSHIVSGRLDLRDNLTQAHGQPDGQVTHTFEVLLGATFTFEREPPPRLDTDRDGLPDVDDECPEQAADTRRGCPLVAAPLEPSGAAPTPCPSEKAPTVTPSAATDEQASEVTRSFSGVVDGITFAVGRGTITPQSYPALDHAVAVLRDNPAVRIEVSGHSSSEGKPQANKQLSLARAQAVRAYLLKKGIAEERVVARGVGAEEPIADNATQAGREQNRRIEFRILSAP